MWQKREMYIKSDLHLNDNTFHHKETVVILSYGIIQKNERRGKKAIHYEWQRNRKICRCSLIR